MTFEAGKTYETRDGREARVYAVDGGGTHPIHGALNGKIGWTSMIWTAAGKATTVSEPSEYDLLAPQPEPRRVTLYDYANQGPLSCTIGPDGVLRVAGVE